MKNKNDYTIIVFLSTGEVKKWKFVHKLDGFGNFLDKEHSSWMYMNVYERRTGKFLKRLYKGSSLPGLLK